VQTYSHALITGALSVPLKRRGYTVHTTAFLLGAVLPDIPFFVLTVLGGIYYTWLAPVPTGESPLIYMHMTLYFNDPLWLAVHNVLHAPVVLATLGLVGYGGIRTVQPRASTWGAILFWFALGAGLHSVIDIFTHAGDGPLLLFPLNWTFRFNSPVSYWDPEHYGQIFSPIEHLLDAALLVYIVVNWRRKRTTSAKTGAPGRR
jgi:hypothetical protein